MTFAPSGETLAAVPNASCRRVGTPPSSGSTNGRAERKRSPSIVLSMKIVGLPPSMPTDDSANAASSSVRRLRSLPSGAIDQRFLSPSRSLSNTMREPSGLNALRASTAGLEVRRTAVPPSDGALQRSPRQVKVIRVPSGESAG